MHSKTGARKHGRFTITTKLILAIVICVAVVMAALMWMASSRMSEILVSVNEELLNETTQYAVAETRAWMNGVVSRMEAQRDVIEFEDMSPEQIKNFVTRTVDQDASYPAGLYAALSDDMSVIHATFVPGPDYDLASKSWYQNGLASQDIMLGDVYFDEDSQSYVVGASGVLKDGGGQPRGVVAADVYLDAISDVVNDVTIGETGGVFIVDKSTDTIIGHKDPALQGSVLSEVADGFYPAVESAIAAKREGLSLEEDFYLLTQSIPGTNWEVVAYVAETEVLGDVTSLARLMMIGMIVAVAIVWILIVIVVRRIIGRPVRALSEAAARIAAGDLDQKVEYRSNDEIGMLADDFRAVTRRLQEYKGYINEIAEKLDDIADGNLAFTLDRDYSGEFEKLKLGLERISKSLNQTMGQIRQASQDVAAGAQAVATGATSLSTGSARQSSEIGSLAAHISSITESVHNIAEGSQQAKTISTDVRHGLMESSDKMTHMTEVIQNISTKSNQINEIVKTIEDIAFQTNILALNAAVEAARAGESGKGFAVVADEVRVLAGKTSDAAQQTTALLSETVASMEEGVKAAQDTGKTLVSVVEQSDKMSELINGIAEYTKTQDVNTQGITHGVDEIASLGNNNVNVAEQSAEASDELSGQAELLKEMVGRFKLKESDIRGIAPAIPSKPTPSGDKKDGHIWMPPSKSKDHNSF